MRRAGEKGPRCRFCDGPRPNVEHENKEPQNAEGGCAETSAVRRSLVDILRFALPLAAALAAMLGLAAPVCGQPPEVIAAEPLMDLAATAPKVSPENVYLELDLEAFAADPRGGGSRLMTVYLDRARGGWRPGTALRHPANPLSPTPADGSGLEVEAPASPDGAGRLAGTLTIGGRECRLDAAIIGRGPRPAWPRDRIDIRTFAYWLQYPKLQGGTWELSGTWKAEGAEGRLSGYARPPERPGFWTWGTRGQAGLDLEFDLGRKRQNWNYGRLALYTFAGARDLSACEGLRLKVATAEPRTDVEVSIWLREEDGSWWRLKSGVALARAENEAVVLFDGFSPAETTGPQWVQDEDFSLDTAHLAQLGLGIVSAFGPGKVAFTVKSIEAVKVRRGPAAPVRVSVTGRTLAVNGQEMVPPGVFGGYAIEMPLSWRPGCQRHLNSFFTLPREGRTEKFIIDCWHDRFGAAVSLTQENWRESMAGRAREFARRARQARYRACLEFWNEPYLNWARDRKTLRPGMFRRAGDDVIAVATGQKLPYFVWEGGEVVDSSQHSYYSARGLGFVYDEMLLAVARAAKDENPDLEVIVSWGFRWRDDHWAGWELEYKPSIDRALPWIDGASEHHYGSDPTSNVGMYEVLAAYGRTKYRKWLYSYNTEAGNLSKVPLQGRADTPQRRSAAEQYQMALYEVRDVLYSLRETPDKLRSRTLLHWRSQAAEGAPAAYLWLKDLRGRLVEAESSDEKVWAVASLDGTDPDAPAPEPGVRLVACLFNDDTRPREVDLTLAAPAGTVFAGGAVESLSQDPETFAWGLKGEKAEARGTSHAMKVAMPGKSAWKIVLPLEGTPPASPQVRRTQFFSPDILQAVAVEKPFATRVPIDPALLKAAGRAWLRLVIEDVAPGEAAVRVGDRTILLPKAYTPENANLTVMVPIDLAALAAETAIEFRVNPGDFAGYRVDVTSVVLESR